VIPELELTSPWALAALALLLVLPRAPGWPLRFLALGALIVAFAGPTAERPGGRVAMLVDVSQSVGSRAREMAAQVAGDWRRGAATFFFAGETGQVEGLAAEVAREFRPESTDLARALQVAAAQGAERILLLSDGAQSSGDALLALPNVPVDTLHVQPRENARLAAVLVPSQAKTGETVEAVAVVESDRPTHARLHLSLDGGEATVLERELPAGRSTFPFRFTVPGADDVTLRARLDVPFEQSQVDDAREAMISVAEDEPILVIGDPSLARLLEAQGLDVSEGGPADIRAQLPYSAVVLRGSAASYTPGQLAQLGRFVENGGGLMMTGGPESFGLGSWYRTPVEAVLPVDTDLRTQVEIPLVALVIVLDRSQSMSTGNPNKLELAKEGALGVIELAYEEDLLGMVVFSDSHSWAFRLRPASARGKREMLAAVLGVGTGGGTILEPAYREALDALRGSQAALKHVIILSDGKLYDGQGPFGEGQAPDFAGLAEAAAAEGITTSAIAIGRSADFELLRQVAGAGGGRYHSALDVNTLPRIFTSEALTATRSLLRDEPLQPVARSHPLSPFEGPLPAIDAYIASSPKPNAEVLLLGEQGEPVLAVGRYGLGRTAAFTSDLNGWTGELTTGPELPALLGSVARWLQARPASYAASVDRQGTELRVVVDAVEDGQYVNGARLEARLAGRTTRLEQVAPGRYEGRLPGDLGEGTVLVVERNEVVAQTRLEVPHPEFETAGGAELLAMISERTGGVVLVSPEGYAPELRRSGAPLWPLFTLAALALFLAELVVRRFSGQRTPPRPERSAGT
jgi:Ca-activated chloride channel family protein